MIREYVRNNLIISISININISAKKNQVYVTVRNAIKKKSMNDINKEKENLDFCVLRIPFNNVGMVFVLLFFHKTRRPP